MKEELFNIQLELGGFDYRKLLGIKNHQATFLVIQDAQPYVLKVSDKQTDSLLAEDALLRDNKHIEGITHRVDFYETKSYFALLKEYFPGDHPAPGAVTRRAQTQLRGTLRQLHTRGYVNFDIREKNVVIAQDKNSGKFIDFDVYSRLPDTSDPEILHFNENKKARDVGRLEKILGADYPS